jgi:hypothetical protein
MLGGMPLPPEFENELEAWLRERFARQERKVLEGVIEMVASMLSEQIKSDGNACRQEFANEFEQLQKSVDRMKALVENMARLEAERAEPVSTKIN